MREMRSHKICDIESKRGWGELAKNAKTIRLCSAIRVVMQIMRFWEKSDDGVLKLLTTEGKMNSSPFPFMFCKHGMKRYYKRCFHSLKNKL